NQSATKLTFLQFEFPYSLNNGYLVWFKCASMPMMTSTGDILWNGILLDITELHNLQQQHSMFFDISADMLCIADFNGYFIDISNAWEKTLGFTTEELKAKPFIEFVHPDDRENTINAAEKLSGQPSAVIGFTNRYMCKDGKYRWLDWNAVTVEGNQKIYAVAHDVTELKKATDDLMKMRDDLELRVKERTEELVQARAIAESANNAKSDFLSSMSHELRTPLNAILGFSQLLELQGEENEETSQYAKIIINAGEHLLSLVNDVLDLSKIESGKLVYDIKSINLHNLLEECINLIRPSIKQTTLTLNIDISDCSYFVYTDQMRLKQVLVNLMSNAIKYNREHGDISLSCEQSDGNIKIIVKDTGIGIKQENFYRVFKPFDRIDAEPHIEGTGIGLSLSKKLIEEMKGSIEFESEYGTGSTFAISVPIDPVHISQQNLNSQENILPMNKKNISSKKIIYIEDNLANMQLIEMIIKKQGGIELITAMQPEEGLEKIRSNKPDLLLLDINLPGMDGFALKKIIDKDPDLKEMKIIGLSSYATSLDIQRAEDAGFDGYITKPIKLDNFLETIMKALQ
ncbi:MAG: ATP-binding protein, partial [Gammaproteobacteria bacterium]|nr:ATP-binding protein [Gammaproteobacteria bacterium]